MSTNPSLPTPDKFFISFLLDEWLKDSRCLDSQEAWDAMPNRRVPYESIVSLFNSEDDNAPVGLLDLMAKEALVRIGCIEYSTKKLHAVSMVQVMMRLSMKDTKLIPRAKTLLVKDGLSENDAEVCIRCASLFLNIYWNVWPFDYFASTQASDNEAIDAEGGPS